MTFIFIFLFVAIGFSQDVNPDNKLLWEITTKGQKKKSYLYGSFHTNDKRVFNFSDSVYFALKNADIVCLETDIYGMFKDWDTRLENLSINYDNSGNPYTSSTSPTITSYGNEDGMPQFLDLYFLQYGLMTDKDFHALESIEEQIGLTEPAFSWPNNPYTRKFTQVEDKSIKLYINGDIEALEKSLRTSLKWNPEFYKQLITDRNYIMADGIDTVVQNKGAFIVVGAGHLGGDKGIVNLLRSKGHKLRPVTSIYSKEPIKEKQEVLAMKNYLYHDSITNIVVSLPGKPFEMEKDGVVLNLIYREMGQGNTYFVEVIEKLETQTMETVAMDYIQSPGDSKKKSGVLDDGTPYIEGISDSYPEGLSWVRVLESEKYFAILKTFGGNKFMNSSRPQIFFNKVWFD